MTAETAEYENYTNSLGLRLRHQLLRVRHMPVRGAVRLSRMIGRVAYAPKPRGTCLVRTLHGFSMLVDPVLDKGLERAIFLSGTYEEGTLRVLKALLHRGGTFFDVGANIGLMSLYAASVLGTNGRVVAFEPMPSTWEILRRNIEINGFNNITAENCALGAASGTIEIYENLQINRGAASLIATDESVARAKVPVMPLDEYVDKNGIGRITCIKVDVEGWELEALRGAVHTLSGADAPTCIIECSKGRPTHGGSVDDIYDLLTSANAYQVFRLRRGKELPSRLRRISKDTLPHHDNIFCMLPEHISTLPADLFEP